MTATKLETFVVSISYYDPGYTTIIVQAKDADDAENIVMKMTSKMKDVEIVQNIPIKDAQALQEFYNAQTMGTQVQEGPLQ